MAKSRSNALPHTELGTDQRAVLKGLYFKTDATSPEILAYTPEMESLHQELLKQTGLNLSIRDTWRALKNLGRHGQLARGTRRTSRS
jgi:hypothetical protein